MIMDKIKQKIIEEIEKQRDEIIKFTQELVKIKSVNPYTPEISYKINEPIEKEVAELIFEKLKEFGLKPKFVSALSNRPNVVCSLKNKGNPTLILNGHMDTVPVGNEKDWRVDPFSAKIIDGKLYGRGAYDMKASLAAMVYTLKVLSELDLSGNLIATFAVDEEPGACSKIGTNYLLEQGLKGNACIVCEPGTKKICIGTKGGYRFKVISRGESISTGSGKWERKEKGNNAVTNLAKILLELEKLKLKYEETELFKDRKPVVTPGTLIKGGNGINIVPDYCEATVDIRLMPGQTKEQVKSEILSCIEKLKIKNSKLNIEIQDLMFVPSVYISKNEKIVKILENNAKLILGRKPEVGVAGSWCDAHFFINKGIPTICGFGPDGDNFHGVNEFVYVDSIIQATKIYSLTAYDFIK
jgi:acetylornithine deacetylase/succinyl-diaminopimelate desuccinylase family protein